MTPDLRKALDQAAANQNITISASLFRDLVYFYDKLERQTLSTIHEIDLTYNVDMLATADAFPIRVAINNWLGDYSKPDNLEQKSLSDEVNTLLLPENTVAAFNDGCSVFVVDDNCYVLMNWTGTKWKSSKWIFPEAVQVLATLPEAPSQAPLLVPYPPKTVLVLNHGNAVFVWEKDSYVYLERRINTWVKIAEVPRDALNALYGLLRRRGNDREQFNIESD